MDAVFEEDMGLMDTEWSNLTEKSVPRTFELRLKKKWYDKTSGKSTPTWILVSATQDKNEDGSVKSVMGCGSNVGNQSSSATLLNSP